jgi:hypothetical protein
MTDVGRAVEPVDGEMAVTVGAAAAIDGSGVGSDGDCLSQAEDPVVSANSNSPL